MSGNYFKLNSIFGFHPKYDGSDKFIKKFSIDDGEFAFAAVRDVENKKMIFSITNEKNLSRNFDIEFHLSLTEADEVLPLFRWKIQKVLGTETSNNPNFELDLDTIDEFEKNENIEALNEKQCLNMRLSVFTKKSCDQPEESLIEMIEASKKHRTPEFLRFSVKPDLEIICKDGKSLYAHKAHLVTQMAYLESRIRVFNCRRIIPDVQSNDNEQQQLKPIPEDYAIFRIEKFSHETMGILLDFIYSCDINMETLNSHNYEILEAVNFFGFHDMEKIVIRSLRDTIYENDKIFDVLRLAYYHKIDDLLGYGVNVFLSNYENNCREYKKWERMQENLKIKIMQCYMMMSLKKWKTVL